MDKYPGNKDRFAQRQRKEPDALAQFFNEMIQEMIVVCSMGFWHLLKSFFSWKAIITIPLVGGMLYGSYYLGMRALHLTALNYMDDTIFTHKIVNWIWDYFNVWVHIGFIFFCFFTPLVLTWGIIVRSIRTKFQKIFLTARLTNGFGDTPKLLKHRKIDKDRHLYLFDSNGVGLSAFEAKREEIEALFRSNIETIKYGTHKGQIAITFSKQKFPEKVSYEEMTAQKILPSDSFYLGISAEGVQTQGVAELPHMLIAGTTGSGKSVFFKQCLLGLLESSPYLQMYLIDLKGGLEMVDFKSAPNVQVIKTLDDAVEILALVEKEMMQRFAYLETNDRKHIDPEKDRKDRIVVAVDEASVLYMNRQRQDPDYELALEARKLADSISKLSRAASIHLLLATQKLDRQVIPTSVSENISGRMAFRANSLQGSLIVLGSKDACELPEIPGRGIWSFGTRKVVIQSPFVDEKTIKSKCERIAEQFKLGKRMMLSPKLGEVEKKKASESSKEVYSQIKRKK